MTRTNDPTWSDWLGIGLGVALLTALVILLLALSGCHLHLHYGEQHKHYPTCEAQTTETVETITTTDGVTITIPKEIPNEPKNW